RVATYFGLLFALLAMLYGLYLLIRTMIWGTDVPGYASTMVAVIFMGGIQLVVLGIIGEYLGRLYSEAKGRPLYIVESRLGFGGERPGDRRGDADASHAGGGRAPLADRRTPRVPRRRPDLPRHARLGRPERRLSLRRLA